MLREVIAACPDSLWTAETPTTPFWQVAYHAIFYTHLYLQPSERDFVPWAKHRDEYDYLGQLPWPPHRAPMIGDPYSRADVLEYLDRCCEEVADRVPALDLSAPSGFSWLPFGKLELQLYSIRHVQQHVGELAERLGTRTGVEIAWVGTR
jgi:hypothetical protein